MTPVSRSDTVTTVTLAGRVVPASWLCAAGAVLTAGLVWSAAIAYLVLTPTVYMSRWTLIIPGAGASTTVQLDSIGQSTTSIASPYSSVSLSPRVVYREIVNSDQVRWSAAESLGLSFREFGRPRVKLVDETSLMMFEIGGSTAEMAQRKANALLHAFNAQLDALRQDELATRSSAVTTNLAGYKAQVDAARHRISDIQIESGLVSIVQFNELVSNLAGARRRLIDLSGEVDRLREEQARLTSRLGIEPAQANIALQLASDPAWSDVVSEYAKANGLHTAEATRLGPANPALVTLAAKRDAALAAVVRRLDGQGLDGAQSAAALLVGNASRQAELLQQLVRTDALLAGKTEELRTLSLEKERLDVEIARLSVAAARLEDLRKEQVLAEAVYSSALARVDTSKSDIYGAYPIVQVVAAPTLPEGYEQPRRLYAVGGGTLGTLAAFFAWGLIWLAAHQTAKRRRKRSSTA